MSRFGVASASTTSQSVQLTIDLAAMPDTKHENDEPVALDLVDYPIRAHANSPQAFRCTEPFRAVWPRVIGE
jgi:hypothetical protein